MKPARPPILVVFVCLLLTAFYLERTGRSESHEAGLEAYKRNLNAIRLLLNRSQALWSGAEQRQLENRIQALSQAVAHWGLAKDAAGFLRQRAEKDCAGALARIRWLLEESGKFERLWIQTPIERREMRLQWPYGSGALLLRIGRQGSGAIENPRFVTEQFDLSQERAVSVEIGQQPAVYVSLFFTNAPGGRNRFSASIRSSGAEVATVDFTVDVPTSGQLKVVLLDGKRGRPTAAAAAVYTRDNQLIVPGEALSFDSGGFFYSSARVRQMREAHYWPGSASQKEAFFVDGSFSLALPEGEYTLIAAKGMEYIPVVQSVTVKAGAEVTRKLNIARWIDMPARGWYSGDGHVHYERADAAANARLSLWARAEDVHVVNVLRMGDALETYYDQYAFGAAGRFVSEKYAIVPGQEDPRTNVMGHTLELNLQSPIRFPDRYYLYDLVFDEVRRQGGLVGYPHAYRPASMNYFVRQDMTLNVPAGRVDFVEFCEYGDIGEDLYYEFLNLGFPLAASAGSDVPYGNTIGTSRVYAYTGQEFSPDAWFAALKAGHTFVTNGPLLELTVDGQIPGSTIQAEPGQTLRIRAAAYGHSVLPQYLEIVSQGEVIRSVRPPVRSERSITAEFVLPVRNSMWIAARCGGAHTTPVYIRIGAGRFWKLDQVDALLANRMRQLEDIDDVIRRGVPTTQRGVWDNPAAFRKNAPGLRARVEAARKIYEDLRREAALQRTRN